MMARLLVLIATALVTACAAAPPERQAIEEAAGALGGIARIQALKAFTVEGIGTSPNAGQNRMPDDELPVWRVDEYARTTDLVNGRTRVRQVREAQFLFAGELIRRQTQGIDGAVAYNVTADGVINRAGDAAARDRRVEMLHHPLTVVRAGLDPGARLGNPRTEGHQRLVDLVTAAGDTVTVALDSQTHLPTRVISMADNPNLGDVAIVTAFADYEDVGGLKLPRGDRAVRPDGRDHHSQARIGAEHELGMTLAEADLQVGLRPATPRAGSATPSIRCRRR